MEPVQISNVLNLVLISEEALNVSPEYLSLTVQTNLEVTRRVAITIKNKSSVL